jgi:cell division transport system permease protein
VFKWIRRHGYAISACVRMLHMRRAGAILTMIVLGLVFALPFALDVLLMNVLAGRAALPPALTLSVYLKPETSEQTARQLAVTARARKDVASVTVISATQALQDLRARSGLNAALDALGSNPLPTVIVVTPAGAAEPPAALETLRTALSAWPETDTVQLDRDWARRLDALLGLLGELLRVSAGLIAVAVLAIVVNSIRLEIRERRAEIALGKLLGGSNAFVRRPFLYLGTLYGLVGALLAWGSVVLAGRALAAPIAGLAAAYGSRLVLRPPGARELEVLFGAGALLGWLGAAIRG